MKVKFEMNFHCLRINKLLNEIMDRKLENRTMNVAMMMWYFQFIALFLVIHVAAIAKLEMCYFIIYACQKSYGNTYKKKRTQKINHQCLRHGDSVPSWNLFDHYSLLCGVGHRPMYHTSTKCGLPNLCEHLVSLT